MQSDLKKQDAATWSPYQSPKIKNLKAQLAKCLEQQNKVIVGKKPNNRMWGLRYQIEQLNREIQEAELLVSMTVSLGQLTPEQKQQSLNQMAAELGQQIEKKEVKSAAELDELKRKLHALLVEGAQGQDSKQAAQLVKFAATPASRWVESVDDLSAVNRAILGEYVECLEQICEATPEKSYIQSLTLAIQVGNLSCFKILLARHRHTGDGEPDWLYLAADYGRPLLLKYLLQKEKLNLEQASRLIKSIVRGSKREIELCKNPQNIIKNYESCVDILMHDLSESLLEEKTGKEKGQQSVSDWVKLLLECGGTPLLPNIMKLFKKILAKESVEFLTDGDIWSIFNLAVKNGLSSNLIFLMSQFSDIILLRLEKKPIEYRNSVGLVIARDEDLLEAMLESKLSCFRKLNALIAWGDCIEKLVRYDSFASMAVLIKKAELSAIESLTIETPRHGKCSVVTYIITRGDWESLEKFLGVFYLFDINAPTQDAVQTLTPVQLALRYGKPSMLRVLVEQDADVKPVYREVWSSLQKWSHVEPRSSLHSLIALLLIKKVPLDEHMILICNPLITDAPLDAPFDSIQFQYSQDTQLLPKCKAVFKQVVNSGEQYLIFLLVVKLSDARFLIDLAEDTRLGLIRIIIEYTYNVPSESSSHSALSGQLQPSAFSLTSESSGVIAEFETRPVVSRAVRRDRLLPRVLHDLGFFSKVIVPIIVEYVGSSGAEEKQQSLTSFRRSGRRRTPSPESTCIIN